MQDHHEVAKLTLQPFHKSNRTHSTRKCSLTGRVDKDLSRGPPHLISSLWLLLLRTGFITDPLTRKTRCPFGCSGLFILGANGFVRTTSKFHGLGLVDFLAGGKYTYTELTVQTLSATGQSQKALTALTYEKKKEPRAHYGEATMRAVLRDLQAFTTLPSCQRCLFRKDMRILLGPGGKLQLLSQPQAVSMLCESCLSDGRTASMIVGFSVPRSKFCSLEQLWRLDNTLRKPILVQPCPLSVSAPLTKHFSNCWTIYPQLSNIKPEAIMFDNFWDQNFHIMGWIKEYLLSLILFKTPIKAIKTALHIGLSV